MHACQSQRLLTRLIIISKFVSCLGLTCGSVILPEQELSIKLIVRDLVRQPQSMHSWKHSQSLNNSPSAGRGRFGVPLGKCKVLEQVWALGKKSVVILFFCVPWKKWQSENDCWAIKNLIYMYWKTNSNACSSTSKNLNSSLLFEEAILTFC